MKNILLIVPPLFFIDDNPIVYELESPSLGPQYLASYIMENCPHFNVKVINMGPENITLTKLKDLLTSLKPFVVGISSLTINLQGFLETAKTVRQVLPNAKIFAGGSHISADPEFINRHSSYFDHAVTGEGEITFAKSLMKLERGEDVPRIQQGETVMDLDSLPFPRRNEVPRKYYIRPDNYQISRGCPYKCYFCSSPAINKKVRYRSVDSILNEVKLDYDFTKGYIIFCDDTFTMNRNLVLELCNRIINEKIKLDWRCVTRIDLIDEEIAYAMKKAGCHTIGFGIEAGSERVRRDIINKGSFSNDTIKSVIKLCRSAGFNVNAFAVLGNPTETQEEIQETIDMMLSIGLSGIAMSLPIPFPGSPLYDMAEADGVINTDIIDCFARGSLGEGVTGVYPLYLNGFDRQELNLKMKNTFMKFYLRPSVVKNFIVKNMKYPKEIMQDIKSAYYLLIKGGSRKRPFV